MTKIIYEGYPAEGIYVQQGTQHLVVKAETTMDWLNFTRKPGYQPVEDKNNWLHGEDHGQNSSAEMGYDGDAWYGTEDYDAWMGLLDNGWAEGADLAAKLADEVAPYIQGMKIVDEPKRDYEGDEVDIDMYLEGDPECMINYEEAKVHGKAKFLTVAIDIGALCDVRKEAMMWRGIIAAALVDTLESNGFRLEIFGYSYDRGRRARGAAFHRDNLIILPVKNEDQHMELERLASLIGHSSSFRRGIFSGFEKYPKHIFQDYLTLFGYGASQSGWPTHFPADVFIGKECLAHDAKSAVQTFRQKLSELPDFYEYLQEERGEL